MLSQHVSLVVEILRTAGECKEMYHLFSSDILCQSGIKT